MFIVVVDNYLLFMCVVYFLSRQSASRKRKRTSGNCGMTCGRTVVVAVGKARVVLV